MGEVNQVSVKAPVKNKTIKPPKKAPGELSRKMAESRKVLLGFSSMPEVKSEDPSIKELLLEVETAGKHIRQAIERVTDIHKNLDKINYKIAKKLAKK